MKQLWAMNVSNFLMNVSFVVKENYSKFSNLSSGTRCQVDLKFSFPANNSSQILVICYFIYTKIVAVISGQISIFFLFEGSFIYIMHISFI